MSQNQAHEVAETILQQMGGVGRIRAMLGVKQFVASPDGVSFQFPNKKRSAPNSVRVVLKGDDTYTVEFYRVARFSLQPLTTHEGMYAEDLKGLFERTTGLYLSF